MVYLNEYKGIKNEAKNVSYPDLNPKAGGLNVSVAEDHEKRITALEESVDSLEESVDSLEEAASESNSSESNSSESSSSGSNG